MMRAMPPVRLLGRAGPVPSGRLLRVGLATADPAPPRRVDWTWGDGTDGHWADGSPGDWRHASHRYAAPGTYRVEVLLRYDDRDADGWRDVAVLGRRESGRQVAGSGTLRGPPGARRRGAPERSPFGFWAMERDGDPDEVMGSVSIAAADAGITVERAPVTWLLIRDDGWCHLGGLADVREAMGAHPYRLDARAGSGGRDRGQLRFSLYAPGSRPGHDAPTLRIEDEPAAGGIVVAR